MRRLPRVSVSAVPLVTALAVIGSGCATTRSMALSKETPAIVLGPQQSLALAAVKVANVYTTSYQPHVKYVVARSMGPEGKTLAFEVAAPFRSSESEKDQFEEFLVSMALAPGTYELAHLYVRSDGLLVHGSGFAPIKSTFTVPTGKAIYLGRVEAVRRERVGDEPRAGPPIPVIDQSVTGYSGGTFDVKVLDGYEHDLGLMRTEYPALRAITVEKQLLPPPPPAPRSTPDADNPDQPSP